MIRAAKFLGVLLAVGVCLAVAAAFRTSAAETEVSVVYPSRGDLEIHYVASGHVMARSVHVSPATGGRIRGIRVKQNEQVRRGQVLANLDDDEPRARIQTLQAELRIAQSRYDEAMHMRDIKGRQIQDDLVRAQAHRQEASAKLRAVERGPSRQELTRARAAVQSAAAKLRVARNEQARSRELFKQDIISKSQMDQLDADLAAATAMYAQAEAELQRLEVGTRREDAEISRAQLTHADAEVKTAQQSTAQLSVEDDHVRAAREEMARIQGNINANQAVLQRTVIAAPTSGVVSQIMFEPGEVVDWNQTLLTIVTSDDFSVEANVDEQDATYVHLDQRVHVSVSALPALVLEGKVVQVAPSLEPRPNSNGDSKILRIKVSLDKPDKALRAGMEADVQGGEVLARNVLMLPRSALNHDRAGDYVMCVHKGMTSRTAVRVGAASVDKIEVRGGLETSTPVVSEAGVRDGMRVRIRT